MQITRHITLKEKDGCFAWYYDDNDSLYSPEFKTSEEATAWMGEARVMEMGEHHF